MRDVAGVDDHVIRALLAELIGAAHGLAQAKRDELIYLARTSEVRSEAISRIMGMADPQKQKPYSATAAAELVHTDAAYALHVSDRTNATVHLIEAAGQYEAAKLRARYAVAKAEVGELVTQDQADAVGDLAIGAANV